MSINLFINFRPLLLSFSDHTRDTGIDDILKIFDSFGFPPFPNYDRVDEHVEIILRHHGVISKNTPEIRKKVIISLISSGKIRIEKPLV